MKYNRFPFVESIEITCNDIKRVADELSAMMRANRVRVSQGASGHYYINYFDDVAARHKQEPFRAIRLPKQQ